MFNRKECTEKRLGKRRRACAPCHVRVRWVTKMTLPLQVSTPGSSLEDVPSQMLFTRQTGGRARGGVLAVSGANTAVWAKQMTKTEQSANKQSWLHISGQNASGMEVPERVKGHVSHFCPLPSKG